MQLHTRCDVSIAYVHIEVEHYATGNKSTTVRFVEWRILFDWQKSRLFHFVCLRRQENDS